LIWGFTFISISLLLAGGIAIWQFTRLGQAISILDEETERATVALEVAQASANLIATVNRVLPAEDPALFETVVGSALEALRERHAELVALAGPGAAEDPAWYTLLQPNSSIESVIGIAETMIRQARASQWAPARVRVAVLTRDYGRVAGEISELVALTKQRRAAAVTRVASARRAAVLYPSMFLLLAAGLVGILAWATVRAIANPVERLTEGASQLAAGRLSERVAIETSDEFGQLARTFNDMAARLQELYSGLEQQVAERTADLERRAVQMEAAAEVARDATAIRDVGQLLGETVHLISDRFGFYHAGVFLVDDKREHAVLRAASSEGGRRMLARGHKLAVGKVGMVGYVTGTGEPRVALDVGEDAVHFVNPDLPETRSEMTLPLRVRGEAIGALDVQSIEEAAFSDEDVAVLQVMADQLAVAIENARLFEQTQASLRELDTLYRLHTREEWERLTQERAEVTGYRYSPAGISPAGEAWWPEIGEAVRRGETMMLSDDGGELLTTPITLRGQAIGAISFRRPAGAEAWSAQDVALMEVTADQVALALESARLMQESRQWAQREFTIREIADKVSASFDLETVLRTTVEKLSAVLGASGALVELGLPQEEMATASAVRLGAHDQDQLPEEET